MGDLGSIPGLGRNPAEGKGYPLEYSGLENCMNYLVHGVAESDMTERFSLSPFTTHAVIVVYSVLLFISLLISCIDC